MEVMFLSNETKIFRLKFSEGCARRSIFQRGGGEDENPWVGAKVKICEEKRVIRLIQFYRSA